MTWASCSLWAIRRRGIFVILRRFTFRNTPESPPQARNVCDSKAFLPSEIHLRARRRREIFVILRCFYLQKYTWEPAAGAFCGWWRLNVVITSSVTHKWKKKSKYFFFHWKKKSPSEKKSTLMLNIAVKSSGASLLFLTTCTVQHAR